MRIDEAQRPVAILERLQYEGGRLPKMESSIRTSAIKSARPPQATADVVDLSGEALVVIKDRRGSD